MPKDSAVEDFITNMSLLEAGAVVHTASSVDKVILTVPTCLADSFEEECINTRRPISRTNFRQTAAVDDNLDSTAQASNDQISTPSEQTVSPLRFSSSIQQASSSSSSSRHRVSTFSHYSSIIVTRKSRISAESDYRKEMAELLTSFSAHPCPDLASIFDFEDSGGDLNEVDLSFLELE
eukprot:CCRYP_020593-RA/>CCRYP_020593-RA protein AED:0.19 eAED:0.43 QI:0/0/0/1/0/0/2/0/178